MNGPCDKHLTNFTRQPRNHKSEVLCSFPIAIKFVKTHVRMSIAVGQMKWKANVSEAQIDIFGPLFYCALVL